jgi:hypothetical protein
LRYTPENISDHTNGHHGYQYTRERNKTEYAYIIEEQKWVEIEIKGDYTLMPVEQHPTIAPLFADPDDTTDMYFVIDGMSSNYWADDGYINIEFLEQHLKTEYATLAEQDGGDDHFNERERLYEMGFKDDEDSFRHVQFKQRKLGE